MKQALLTLFAAACLLPDSFAANVAPTVVIKSATMRPGTTLMDVVYRVNDPDDGTVKTRALAFRDGVRSFANVIKPVTFVEGTAVRLGDAIPSNTDLTLTWDVGADWNIDLGQIKFEVLAMDGRGLLRFDWITIPAAGGNPPLTVSKNSPTDSEVRDGLFWQFADGDTGLALENGVLSGSSSSGAFSGISLVEGDAIQSNSTVYILKRMNLAPYEGGLAGIARVNLLLPTGWHATTGSYGGSTLVSAWAWTEDGQLAIPHGLSGVTQIAAGRYHTLALKGDGSVVGWTGGFEIPHGLSGVTSIAAGDWHGVAVKDDGSVVVFGGFEGMNTIPIGLNGVASVAAGLFHTVALKKDGTVVSWGAKYVESPQVPENLSGVVAIAACEGRSAALKNDGTVVTWGEPYYYGMPGVTGVVAIGCGDLYNAALKNDGTVVLSGLELDPRQIIMSGVKKIFAGKTYLLALKSNDEVVMWKHPLSDSSFDQESFPSVHSGVVSIASGLSHVVVLRRDGVIPSP